MELNENQQETFRFQTLQKMAQKMGGDLVPVQIEGTTRYIVKSSSGDSNPMTLDDAETQISIPRETFGRDV